MTWTSLHRWLDYSGKRSFFLYLWMIPLVTTALEFTNNVLATSFRLPLVFFNSFIAAALYIVAHLIYRFSCPPELKSISSKDEWIDKASREAEDMVHGLEVQKRLIAALEDTIDSVIDQEIRNSSEGIITASEAIGIKRIFRRQLASLPIEIVLPRTLAAMNSLERSHLLFRLVATGCLGLSLLWIAGEFVVKLYKVVEATF